MNHFYILKFPCISKKMNAVLLSLLTGHKKHNNNLLMKPNSKAVKMPRKTI